MDLRLFSLQWTVGSSEEYRKGRRDLVILSEFEKSVLEGDARMKCKSTPYQGMDKRFAYLGEWWLPEQPGKKFRGILTYEPRQNVSLKLFGTGKELESSFEGYWKQETLLGVSSSGEQITVRECYIGQSSTSQSPKGTKSCVVLEPAWVFIGAHFVSDEEVRFDSVEIQYPYLAYWLKFPPRNPDSGDSANSDAENEGSDFHTIVLDNFATLSIELAPDLQRWPSSGTSDYALREPAYVRFEFAGRTSLEMIWTRYKRQWEHFFSLAMGRPAYALDVRGVLSDYSQKKIAIIEGIGYRQDFYVMFPFLDMLFRYKEVEDHIDTYLNNWYSKMGLLEPVCNLYFAVVYESDLYLEHKFLTYVIALETYHKVVTNNAPKFCKEVYDFLVEKMLESIPQEYEKEYKCHFENRLKFGNEPTFRQRLRCLMGNMPEVSNTFICHEDPGCKDFVHVVTETRNSLIHYGKWRSLGGVQTIDELSAITKKLKMVVQSCLLREMGLSDSQICWFFEQTSFGEMLRRRSNK